MTMRDTSFLPTKVHVKNDFLPLVIALCSTLASEYPSWRHPSRRKTSYPHWTARNTRVVCRAHARQNRLRSHACCISKAGSVGPPAGSPLSLGEGQRQHAAPVGGQSGRERLRLLFPPPAAPAAAAKGCPHPLPRAQRPELVGLLMEILVCRHSSCLTHSMFFESHKNNTD